MQELVKEQAGQKEAGNERAVEKMVWDEKVHGPRGILGWLLVPVIGMVLSMFFAVFQLFTKTIPALFTYSEVVRIETRSFREVYDSEWTTILIFDGVFYGALFIYISYVIIELMRERWIVPRLMIILYSANILSAIIRTVLLLTTVEAVSEELKQSYWSIAIAVVIGLVWIPYFKLSVRVENTFSKEITEGTLERS
ncbi:DUF2569 domain-containing protein [Paenibacillus sp. NPDC058071]|uniref:DUF2569 domain-containing protein n=1 Tax=Paenibacillus sp. NPDC058071 TaxID=3346326 RepID=UPI0036DB6F67